MPRPFNHIIVVFRNDDISGLSDVDHECQVAAVFEQYKVPQTIGLIPFYTVGSEKSPRGNSSISLGENLKVVDFIRKYRDSSGSEIALHGYRHQANQFSRPWRREYFEFKLSSLEEQEERIRRGTEIISQTLHVVPETFIPSWNRLDLNTLLACKKNGYKIVSAGVYTPAVDGLISFGENCDLTNLPILLQNSQRCGARAFYCVNYHSRFIKTKEEYELLRNAVSLAAGMPECEAITISEAVRRFPSDIKTLNEAGKNVASQETVFDPVRGRALIYRKVFSFLPQARNLNSTYTKSKESYFQGMYDAVCSFSSSVDRESKDLILRSRTIACVIGFVSLILLLLLISWIAPFSQILSWIMTFLVLILFWTGCWWYGTSIETKKEIRYAGVLSLMGGGIGILLFYFLRYLF